PVVDPDVAPGRQGLDRAPEVVVIELFLGRLDEARNLAPAWIDARQHVLDRAVLSRGVHRLQHDQQRPRALRVQPILRAGQARHCLMVAVSGTRYPRNSRSLSAMVLSRSNVCCRFSIVETSPRGRNQYAASEPSSCGAPTKANGRPGLASSRAARLADGRLA